jgi:hypothetical protein
LPQNWHLRSQVGADECKILGLEIEKSFSLS